MFCFFFVFVCFFCCQNYFAFELAPVVADLYNSTLREGFIPPLLKSVIVHPLPKVTPPKCIEDDVRPISLTCQLAKVLEGFTLSRVYPSIVGNLDRNQFAVAGKSTEQALVYVLHLALEALDRSGCYLRLFFADFRKGFDLIDHLILMEKLSTPYSLHWSLLRWVASFLRGRAQVTRVGASVSAPLYLNGGIPQSTKLGPVLFAVVVNDLVQSWGACIKFVDDLTVLEVVPRNSSSLLNVVVDDIHAVAVNNNMRLNPHKCKTMTVDFLQYSCCFPCPIAVGGSDIEQVSTFKLLGVHLSEELTWAVHCDYIVKKANRRRYALRQLKKCKVP